MHEHLDQVNLASGGSGGGSGGSSFRAGQKLNCRLLERTQDGYNVFLVDFALVAFLQSEEVLDLPDLFIGEFLCAHRGRLMVRVN